MKMKKSTTEKFNEAIKEARSILSHEIEAECLSDVGIWESVAFNDYTRSKEFRMIFAEAMQVLPIGRFVLPKIGFLSVLNRQEQINSYLAEVFFSMVKEFKIDNDGDDELPF